MSTKALKGAAVVFVCVAMLAGGLQVWAFVATGGPRHLVVGIFALAVGVSVLLATIRGFGHGRDPRK